MKPMITKKKVLFLAFCITFSGILAFLIGNYRAISNILFDYKQMEFTTQQIELLNWNKQENLYVSGEDPQIILNDVNTYVNTVDVYVNFDSAFKDLWLFYQQSGDETFSIEKSYRAQNLFMDIPLKTDVTNLRIDVLEQAGISVSIEKIVLNSHHIGMDMQELLLWVLICLVCLLPIIFKELIREVYQSRTIFKALIKNDLKSRYAGSFLGVAWAFVQPVLTILVFWFVFEFGFRNAPVDNVNYILWFIPAYIPWIYFSDLMVNATGCLREYSYLVKKIKFRISILPVMKVCSSMIVHFCFVAFMLAIYAVYGQPVDWMYLQLIYYGFALSFWMIGLSWLISAISVFLKDFSQIINVVLQLGFFMIPIFWSPEDMSPMVVQILKFNPIYYIVQGYRECMIDKVFFWDHPTHTLYFWSIALGTFALGAVAFKKLRVHFADLL